MENSVCPVLNLTANTVPNNVNKILFHEFMSYISQINLHIKRNVYYTGEVVAEDRSEITAHLRRDGVTVIYTWSMRATVFLLVSFWETEF